MDQPLQKVCLWGERVFRPFDWLWSVLRSDGLSTSPSSNQPPVLDAIGETEGGAVVESASCFLFLQSRARFPSIIPSSMHHFQIALASQPSYTELYTALEKHHASPTAILQNYLNTVCLATIIETTMLLNSDLRTVHIHIPKV